MAKKREIGNLFGDIPEGPLHVRVAERIFADYRQNRKRQFELSNTLETPPETDPAVSRSIVKEMLKLLEAFKGFSVSPGEAHAIRTQPYRPPSPQDIPAPAQAAEPPKTAELDPQEGTLVEQLSELRQTAGTSIDDLKLERMRGNILKAMIQEKGFLHKEFLHQVEKAQGREKSYKSGSHVHSWCIKYPREFHMREAFADVLKWDPEVRELMGVPPATEVTPKNTSAAISRKRHSANEDRTR